jgi:CheY-like chemotaxis protein
VIKIVISNNPTVFRQLGSRGFQRAGATHKVVTSGREALDAVRTEKPNLLILDIDLPDADGYQVSEAVKSDPKLKDVRVILVVGTLLGRPQIDKIAASRCDDVFCAPATSDDLFSHVARLFNIPHRLSTRIKVLRNVVVEVGKQTLDASLMDISSAGAQVRLRQRLAPGMELVVNLARSPDERPVGVKARVVWDREDVGQAGFLVGMQFLAVTKELQKSIDNLALWELHQGPASTLLVSLHGHIDEATDFGELQRKLASTGPGVRIEFDLAHMTGMNSWGVRRWVAFLKAIPAQVEYDFLRAPIFFIAQVNMVAGTLQRGRIISCFVPYACDNCDHEDERLLQVTWILIDGRLQLPQFNCSQCNHTMEMGDLAERYFSFLRRR